MKKTLFPLLLALVLLALSATALAAPNFSFDSYRLDFSSGRCVFDGNIRIVANGCTFQADHAEVDLATALKYLKNGAFDAQSGVNSPDFEVWCEGNVSVSQDGLKLTGDKAHVIGKTHEAVVEGNVFLERPKVTIQSDSGLFNWDTQVAQFDDNVRIRQGNREINAEHAFYDVAKDELL